MTHSIHVSAKALHSLLAPVIPFADKGDSLPVLSALRVRGHGSHLTAFATDRYRAAVQRVKAEAPADLDVILPLTSARQILATFKPTRRLNPELTLTFDGETNRVTVESGALGDSLFDARMSFGLIGAEYPKALSVLVEAADAEAVPLPSNFALNPHFLADLRGVTGDATPMQIHVGTKKVGASTPTGPAFIAIGDDFRAVIMPTRRKADEAVPLLDDSWRALLTEPAKVESKPARKPRAKKAVA